MWDIETLLEKTANNKVMFSKSDYAVFEVPFNRCQILLASIIYDYENGEDYLKKDQLRKNIHKQFYYIFNGCEPAFDNSHSWGYSLLAQSIALIKNKESLWNLFSREEKEKLTLIMTMFAFMWNLGCNKFNNYKTGIGLHGNYNKKGTNYFLCNGVLLLFVIPFFGNLEYVNNKIFAGITYDELLIDLKRLKFENAYATWTTPCFQRKNGEMAPGARELFGSRDKLWGKENQNEVYFKDPRNPSNELYGGWGKNCTLYAYFEDQPDDYHTYPFHIFDKAINLTFTNKPCRSVIKIETEEDLSAHIADGTISPYEGQPGLMFEFDEEDDGFGRRSSLFHCEIDFVLTVTMIETLKYLVNFDFESYSKKDIIKVGINDFIYKKEHGYTSYSLGCIERSSRKLNSEIWLDWWKIRR